MKKISIQFTPELDDYLEAYTYFEKKTIQGKTDKIVAVFLIVFGVTLAVFSFLSRKFDLYSILAFAFILIGLLEICGALAFKKMVYKHRLKRDTHFSCKHEITMNDSGLIHQTEGIKSSIGWDFYNRFMESRSTLLLVYGRKQFTVLPKTAFKEKDLVLLKQFLETRYPST